MDLRKTLLAAASLLALLAPSHGQFTRGVLSGIIQDPAGAAVAGAEVKITSLTTGWSAGTQTNAAGVYRLSAVEAGAYLVEFSKAGFPGRRIESLEVGPAREVVLNQVLGAGSAAPAGLALSKATATQNHTLGRPAVARLPVFSAGARDRDVTRMALLAPGVARAPGSTQMSAHGQRARNNNFLIDGVDNNDLTVTQANNRVIPEAVAEVQVQNPAYSAEFGRNSGAQISVLTRSGTNRFQGEWFEYFRSNVLEPLSLLNERAGLRETPRSSQHDAGGALGGPLARDRTFFFGLLETNRMRQEPDARNASSVTIPTPSGYAALARAPLAPGQSPASRQAVLSELEFLPGVHAAVPAYDNLQNVFVNGVPVQVGAARIPLANPFDFWFVQGRLDHRLAGGDSLSYRAQIDRRSQRGVVSNLGFGEVFTGAQLILSQNHMLSHSRGLGPRLWNQFRAAYMRRNVDAEENAPHMPTVAITGYFTIGGANNFPQGRLSNKFQFADVATYLVGRHALKFGADVRRNRLFSRDETDTKGTWTFNSLADFINNQAFSLSQAINTATYDARQTNQFYFFQDDFKAARNLTLSLGLRYEYSGVPFGFFGAESPEASAAGVPPPVRPDRNNWAPRLGAAYSPPNASGLLGALLGRGQTVFRAGYGMGYDVLFYNLLTVNASNYPRVVVQLTNQPATINLFPALAPRQSVTPVFNPLATFVNSPADLDHPTVHFHSFAIQRQAGRDYLFEAAYMGSRSYHALRQGQANPGVLSIAQAAAVRAGGAIPSLQNRRVNPAWGSRVLIESTGWGNYNALILRFDKKVSRGLLFGASYTWSASFSDSDEALAVADITNSSPQVPQDYFNYRNEWSRSVFDRPERLVFHYHYEIPWFRARFANRFLLGRAMTGWSVAGTSEWQSGQPFTVRTGVDSGGAGVTGPFRPDYNPDGTFAKDPVSGDLRTFRSPIDGTGIFLTPLTASRTPLANSMPGGGNLGRNTFRGPALALWNLSLAKRIRVTERVQATLRADWSNFFNHRNFGNPTALMVSPAFGANTSDPGGRTLFVVLKIGF